MPTLSVVAVFASTTGWVQYEFADHTRSMPFDTTKGIAFEQLAVDLDSAAWTTLQIALRNQGKWITVGNVNSKSG